MDVGDLGAGPAVASRRHPAGIRGVARILDVAIVLSGLAALALFIAGARAPRFVAAIAPAAVSSDGGHAYVFAPGFAPHWPYAVPSHPHDVLAQGDVAVLEDERPIGALDPSHADIRERGGGLHNLWDGSLWFSPSDGGDPRTNGRDYRLVVKGRLAPLAALVGRWSRIALVIAIGVRLGMAAQPGFVRGGRRAVCFASEILRRIRLTAQFDAVLGVGRPLRHAAGMATRATAGIVKRSVDALSQTIRFVPLSFERTFVLVSAIALGDLVWQTASRPARLLTQSDSLGYIGPGLIWAAGQDPSGRSFRDLGYPVLTLLAVRLGSLATLPRIQLLFVVAGIACLLGLLYGSFSMVSRRLERLASIPRWATGVIAAAAAAALIALFAGHDLFMIDIESVMAEAPHVLPTALAALLFVGGWVVSSRRRSAALFASACVASYASAMFKPSTLLVFALCAASLLYTLLRHRRGLLTPGLVALLAVALTTIVAINRVDARLMLKDMDLGPKLMFCNRLDVIRPVFDTSTPERRRVAARMDIAMADVNGWPLMGYSGDMCTFNQAFTDAVLAASQSENVTASQWEQREILHGILKNPSRYMLDIVRQTVHFLFNTIQDIDNTTRRDITPDEERILAPYAGLVKVPRESWNVEATNWMSGSSPWLIDRAKRALTWISTTFAVVTLSATALAALVLVAFGRGADCRIEVAQIAIASFTFAFIGTVLLSHSFDIGRYATDILPISLIWWFMSALYVGHLVVILVVLACRSTVGRHGRVSARAS